VGYWVGMCLSFWIGSASADVIVVGAGGGYDYFSASCPSGVGSK
jgi:hypothetical protein